MTAAQSKTAKLRYARGSEGICGHCGGSGRFKAKTMATRSRQGGNQAYLNSLQAGQLSMSERGQMGGRPRRRILANVKQILATNQILENP